MMDKHISVKGIVQGVGFRPFVHGLATRLNLHGWVCNTSGGVEIVIQGQESNVDHFIQSLRAEAPLRAKINSMAVFDELESRKYSTFDIRSSNEHLTMDQSVQVDIGVCPDCERELFNPRDRRYLYPFINCANCGPRFTVTQDIPYDRLTTTMSAFPMCGRCHAEFGDPQGRRFHAQSIACPECGPFVELRETHSQFPTSDPRISSIEIRTSAILKARRLLREGYIVAIKGLGGFHLACDASNPYTVAELRDRKGRIDKPFAVMAANITVAASVCEVQRAEQMLLAGPEKPIVLLHKQKPNGFQAHKVSELVAPNLDTLGVMLPYTPLHHLLLNQTDPVLGREPVPPILVMTSSNFSEEPIATDNKEALQKLSSLADAFLLHNRDIHIRCDDSVLKLDQNNIIHLRRSRGYAPYSIELPFQSKPTLAVGGELKNAFCLTREGYAFMSHHIGDMGNAETHESFEHGIVHLSRVLRVQAEMVAHDLNPSYFATRYAKRSRLRGVEVQHHHAHIAACMADNGLDDRRVIGLAFDGTGYGTDGAAWGGEVLLASFGDFERFAHLQYLPLPERNSALLAPWRVAAAYTHALGIPIDDLPFLQNIDKQVLAALRQDVDTRLKLQPSSSMGQLFEAVASLIGVRNESTYEAQAAMEMEALSRPFISAVTPYPYEVATTQTGVIIRLRELLSAITEDIRANQSIGMMGARFHKTVADMAVDICIRARTLEGLNEVALSGGVWQNQILLSLVCDGLEQSGFHVYVHRQVPTNDGGLALGQAVIANYMSAQQNAPAGTS